MNKDTLALLGGIKTINSPLINTILLEMQEIKAVNKY